MPVITLNGEPTFQGEMLLLGWSENNRDGMTVRLALDAIDEDGHPFKGLGTGKHGQRFAAVIIPVTDEEPKRRAEIVSDETPAPQKRQPRRWEDMPPSQAAALACQSGEFQKWLAARDVDSADAILKRRLNVKSKSDLDASADKAHRWWKFLGHFRNHQTDQRYGDEMR